MIKEAIAQLVKRNDLTAETMGEVMEEIIFSYGISHEGRNN